MGCSTTKSQVRKIKIDLVIEQRKIQKLNQQLKQIEQEIEKLDNEKRFDEADLKDLEYQQVSKEKKILINDIKSRKKTLAGLEQVDNKTKSLQEQNKINEENIKKKMKTKELLEKRGEISNKMKDLDEEMNGLYNSQELDEMEESQYKPNRNQGRNQNQFENQNRNSNRNQIKNQETQQQYPPANQAYPFEPLKLENCQNNQIFQQPLQQSVLSN